MSCSCGEETPHSTASVRWLWNARVFEFQFVSTATVVHRQRELKPSFLDLGPVLNFSLVFHAVICFCYQKWKTLVGKIINFIIVKIIIQIRVWCKSTLDDCTGFENSLQTQSCVLQMKTYCFSFECKWRILFSSAIPVKTYRLKLKFRLEDFDDSCRQISYYFSDHWRLRWVHRQRINSQLNLH